MISRNPSARRPSDRLVALVAPVFVALAWIILFLSGWRGYLAALGGFVFVMMFLKRGELPGRVRNWKTTRRSKELKKAA
jgi:hypothetical protein